METHIVNIVIIRDTFSHISLLLVVLYLSSRGIHISSCFCVQLVLLCFYRAMIDVLFVKFGEINDTFLCSAKFCASIGEEWRARLQS